MTVHSILGCGFLEPVYQEALELEFKQQAIPYNREVSININYRETLLEKSYRADFVCFDKIIVELKAVSELTAIHEAQLMNYLKASKHRIGLLINFGDTTLRHKRFIL